MRRHLSNRKATITTGIRQPSKSDFEWNDIAGKMVRKAKGREVVLHSNTRSNWSTMAGANR